MPLCRKSTVEPVQTKMKTLVETLKPFWMLTYYCGIFPDWCQPVFKTKIGRLINICAVTINLVLVLTMGALFLEQLVNAFNENVGIQHTLNCFIWFSICPVSVSNMFYVILRRNRFLTFFAKWNDVEMSQKIAENWNSTHKWTVRYTHSNVVLVLVFALLLGYFVFLDPFPLMNSIHRSTLLSAFPAVAINITLLLATSIMVASIFVSAAIPVVVYYQAATALGALESATRRTFHWKMKTLNTEADEFITLWSLFEKIRVRIDEINRLFGFFVIVSDAFLFASICVLIDIIVLSYKSISIGEIIVYIFSVLAFFSVLVVKVLLSSKVVQTSRKLATALASLLSVRFPSLENRERQYALVYLSNVQTNHLCAKPCDLYTIEVSLLLSVLSVISTYTVILLQSN